MNPERIQLDIRGTVQGVGFRPFIHRLASEFGLSGTVCNTVDGVTVEAEGSPDALRSFLTAIEPRKPERSSIRSLECRWFAAKGASGFEILESRPNGEKTAMIAPDIATCSDCLAEIIDPTNRRYRYPFTNCTQCGPRYSLIEALPYDRQNTTMRAFTMCSRCRAEYEDPTNRRFHAEPNACPDCGPKLTCRDSSGKILTSGADSFERAAEAIRDGRIVALKGIGGFQLVVSAVNEGAVTLLRERKHRAEKPFALMVPSLEMAAILCEISPMEERLLQSPEAPIVLLNRKDVQALEIDGRDEILARSIAPGNPAFGIMLPYSPLHHLLLRRLGTPVVATSGNVSEEPIVTDDEEAVARLGGIADLFLTHDRPITRPVDDSVVRVALGRELVLRRARGYAPLPVSFEKGPSVLAVGAHLKNTVAQSHGENVFISQHIGDLENEETSAVFKEAVQVIGRLYEKPAEAVAADLHPDYRSSRFAETSGLPVVKVQHHYAHVLSCMAENELTGAVLGMAWDGTGLGDDGTIWGGEFLVVGPEGYTRAAHLRTFRLLGNDRAVKEPRRSAVGVLHEIFGNGLMKQEDLRSLKSFSRAERTTLHSILTSGVNSPVTSSMGRLFDAVCSILGIRHIQTYEGQAPMELEYAARDAETNEFYEPLVRSGIVDWEPLIRGILEEMKKGVKIQVLAAKFHNTIVEQAVGVAKTAGVENIALSGGCFQNTYLLEKLVSRLREEHFRPYWHQRVPPNDGGLCLGQISAAFRELKKKN